ncbi:hypothetical protein ABT56_18795 [Photobacterium aquae]|uniref:TraG P-loop domain-containing protein n=1 Tax=Photobacterium aquae TaxID=1195763 RepID=A0A0J1GV29_9GAMM|nr:type IV secretion system protein TraC [Photobacterium aquae]KLV03486.1 hypothetical protein ABT56_18795 [Photobacterium aquae]
MIYKFKKNHSSSAMLFRPIAYDENHHLFICDDNTAAMSFICTPLCGRNVDVVESLGMMMNDYYPENTMLSFSLVPSTDIKQALTAYDNIRRFQEDSLSKRVHDSVLGFYWDGTNKYIEDDQFTRVKDYVVVVTAKIPVSNMELSSDEIETFKKIQRTILSRLNRATLNPVKMTSKMLVNLMNMLLQKKFDAEWRTLPQIEPDDSRELNTQFLQYNVPVIPKDDGLLLGEPDDNPIHVKMLTARNLPKKSHVGKSWLWYGDPFEGHGHITTPFLITLNIQFPNNQKKKDEADTKYKYYTQLVQKRVHNFAPKVETIKKDLDAYIRELVKYRAIKISLSAAIFGSTEDEAESAIGHLDSYMKVQGVIMSRETRYSIPSFVNMLPMGADSGAVIFSQRYFTMASRQVLPLLPIFADWKGTGTPALFFVSRTGQLMTFSLFDNPTNYNTVIYAESGAGKSVLGNELIRSYLTMGAKIWAVDAGESYKKQSLAFNGNFVSFDSDTDFSLNPFTMIDPDDPNAFDESVETLTKLLTIMAFKNGNITDYQEESLTKILYELWTEKSTSMTIDDVAELCKENDDKQIRELGHQLFRFTSGGPFGKYFNKPHNVSFKGNFNVLELDGLSKNESLQSVVLYLLVVQIQQEMYVEYKKNRDIPRIVLIDEAWQLLGSSETVTKFMELTARRARKYNGALVIITQSINDLQKTESGRAIAENAANSLILKQKISTLQEAEEKNTMSLPESGYQLLRKVVTVTGKYSEVFFNTGAGMGIGRLILDPARLLMYSTHSKDNSAIDKYLRKNYDIPTSLIKVMEERGINEQYTRPSFMDFLPNKTRSDFNFNLCFDKGNFDDNADDIDSLIFDGVREEYQSHNSI